MGLETALYHPPKAEALQIHICYKNWINVPSLTIVSTHFFLYKGPSARSSSRGSYVFTSFGTVYHLKTRNTPLISTAYLVLYTLYVFTVKAGHGHCKFQRKPACKPLVMSIATKCWRTLSGLFSPDLIGQSSCRILTTHDKTRPILHDDWSIRLGENRPDWTLKHLVAMLSL